jgi:hypothetical protein
MTISLIIYYHPVILCCITVENVIEKMENRTGHAGLLMLLLYAWRVKWKFEACLLGYGAESTLLP